MTSRAGIASGGFSLIELVLVLALLGVSSLIVVPNINRGMRAQELRRTALELAAVARNLRSRAVYDGVPQQLIVRVRENRYVVPRRHEFELPRSVKFAEVYGGEALDGESRRFVFFPNGSVLGGTVGLALADGAAVYAVRLEPLTGRVRVLQADPS